MSWEDTQFEVTESTMTMEPQRISKPPPQVQACSGSLQRSYRDWLQSGTALFEAVGHYGGTSCGVMYVRNERGCTLDDIEDAPMDNYIVFPGHGIYARGCTRLLGYNTFERGCTRKFGASSTSGFVVTEWLSENSIYEVVSIWYAQVH